MRTYVRNYTLLSILAISSLLFGCQSHQVEETPLQLETPNTITYEHKTEVPEIHEEGPYYLNETWTVPDQWNLTITGIQKRDIDSGDKMLPFVYSVSYKYENIGYNRRGSQSLQLYLGNNLTDKSGTTTKYYLSDEENVYAEEIPIGETFEAVQAYMTASEGPFEVTVSTYDADGNYRRARFVLTEK